MKIANNKPNIIIAEKIPIFYLKITNKCYNLSQTYNLIWIENIQDLMFAIKKHSPLLLVINDNLSSLNISEIKEYITLLKLSLPIFYLYEEHTSLDEKAENKQLNYLKKDIPVEKLVNEIKKYLSL